MSAEMTSPHGIDDETLAAFAEGRLDRSTRARVTEHLADCAECRDTIDMIAEAQAADVIPDESNVVRTNRFRYAVPIVAAAAAAVIIFFLPPVQERITNYRAGGGVPALVDAWQFLPVRETEARLSGGFAHKDYQSPARGEHDTPPDESRSPLDYATANIEASVDAQSKSPQQLHALAMALLLDRRPREAVPVMQRAVDIAGSKADARMLSDLAAMYHERGVFTGDDDGSDARAAVRYAERAWAMRKSPEIAWNLALAYEQAGRTAEAIAMWREYLRLDPKSPWATEAQDEHLAKLTSGE